MVNELLIGRAKRAFCSSYNNILVEVFPGRVIFFIDATGSVMASNDAQL